MSLLTQFYPTGGGGSNSVGSLGDLGFSGDLYVGYSPPIVVNKDGGPYINFNTTNWTKVNWTSAQPTTVKTWFLPAGYKVDAYANTNENHNFPHATSFSICMVGVGSGGGSGSSYTINAPKLTSLNIIVFESFPTCTYVFNCPSLTDVNLGYTQLGSLTDFKACPLTTASVDSVLKACLASNGGTLNVAGLCSPPSATGLAYVAVLQAAGKTVLHN